MSEVNLVEWLDLQFIEDSRGQLLVIESSQMPFSPARFFLTTVLEEVRERGGHSHKECWQILFCISGEIEVHVVTNKATEIYLLKRDGRALMIPPGYWSKQIFRNVNSVLGAIASHQYDSDDYVYEIP
jgi:hypothetical protein